MAVERYTNEEENFIGPRLVEKPNISIEEPDITEELKEKKEPSLGEFNPLLFAPNLSNPEAVEALTQVTKNLIKKYGGIQPEINTRIVEVNWGPPKHRFVARFGVDSLTEEQFQKIEGVARQIYGKNVKTRKKENGEDIAPTPYPQMDNKKEKNGSNTPVESIEALGWYMGPDPDKVSTGHEGILVHRDLVQKSMANYVKGVDAKDWFFKKKLKDPVTDRSIGPQKYNIEIREGSRYQTDIVEEIVQISRILGGEEALSHKELLYEVYNTLNRLGLEKPGENGIYGLDETIEYIDQVLFLPLANLGLSRSIDAKAGSILNVGVPGTGKTLIAKHFLTNDNGVFFVPVDPYLLASDWLAPPDKKSIIPRISQVFADTGIPVILHLDDIENITDEDSKTNSTLLNLMAGVRESGFYVMASTNFPEKLNVQLLQPERFGHVIYYGLPDKETRKGILDVHAISQSKNKKFELFESEEQRNIILDGLVAHTEYFTARFLADICLRAKTKLMRRVAKDKGVNMGLIEDNLEGYHFTYQDWASAYSETSARYNKEATKKRDEELLAFVDKFNKSPFGFPLLSKEPVKLLQTFEELAAAKLTQ